MPATGTTRDRAGGRRRSPHRRPQRSPAGCRPLASRSRRCASLAWRVETCAATKRVPWRCRAAGPRRVLTAASTWHWPPRSGTPTALCNAVGRRAGPARRVQCRRLRADHPRRASGRLAVARGTVAVPAGNSARRRRWPTASRRWPRRPSVSSATAAFSTSTTHELPSTPPPGRPADLGCSTRRDGL